MGKNRKAINNGICSKPILKEYEYLPAFTRIRLKDVKALYTGYHTEIKDDTQFSIENKIIPGSVQNCSFSIITHMPESSLQRAQKVGT